jgi:hypothetical protein
MKKLSILAILLSICLISCVNLKELNSYSSNSLNAITKFEDISYSFRQHCLEKCQLDAIKKFEIKRDTGCKCASYATADSVTRLIYNSIRGYFDGLTNLSNNDLTTYSSDALNSSLTTGNFGGIKIDSSEVAAYSKIAKIILKATTDLYREKKLKKYIEEANGPLQLLFTKFQFIESNLWRELNLKKDDLFNSNKRLLEKNLTDYEKISITKEYYQQLSDILAKQQQITVFVKSIKAIADGHQKLYEKRNTLSEKDLKDALKQYAGNIKEISSEFNKLKK